MYAVHVVRTDGADSYRIVRIYLSRRKNVHSYPVVGSTVKRRSQHCAEGVDACLFGKVDVVIRLFVVPCGDVDEHSKPEGVVAVTVSHKNGAESVYRNAACAHYIHYRRAAVDKVTLPTDFKHSCRAVTVGRGNSVTGAKKY